MSPVYIWLNVALIVTILLVCIAFITTAFGDWVIGIRVFAAALCAAVITVILHKYAELPPRNRHRGR